MSRRGRGRGRGGNNNIRGPTSALTEFLRDAGITHATIARRVATQQPPADQQQQDQQQGQQQDRQQNGEQAAAGPSNAQPSSPPQPQASGSGSSRPERRATRRTSGYGSDNLDEDEDAGEPMDEDVDENANDEEEPEPEAIPAPAAKKRKLTKAAEAKLKAQEKKKAKAAAKKKKGKGDDDDDFDDSEDEEDDDPYTSLSKSMWTSNNPRPPVGSFENCARCGKQFTVTKYTLAANPPPGWLCHVCAKSSGQDPFKKAAAPRKRKPGGDKREITHYIENRLPTLVSLCIKLVTKHIDDVESLGDIGSLNLEAISKAMSKNRSLTSDNAKLFYSATHTKLTFYDATNLSSPALETLAFLNPNLTSLRLDFCGQLDDSAFKAFTTSLPALERIELLGPFLVREAAWKAFAKAHPNLEGFLIMQSPRFDLDCMRSLVKHCPGLKELRLKEFGKMSDRFLEEIAKLGEGLTYLDISCPGQESCSEAAVIELLEAVGASLKSMDVAKHDLLTDRFLMEGLAPHTRSLESLNLSHLAELTDEGVAAFFEQWENAPLVQLDMSRIHELKGKALEAIMGHSGSALEVLSVNGWKEVEDDALRTVGRLGKALRRVDVGFCRNVDDFVVKAWLEGEEVGGVVKGGCKELRELKVWGCNRLTDRCPKKAGVVIHGVESHIIRMN